MLNAFEQKTFPKNTAQNPVAYIFAQLLCFCVYSVLFRMRVYGFKNFPKHGPYLVASNHQSFLDPMLVGCTVPRFVHSIAKKELFEGRFWNWAYRALNAHPIERGRGDVGAIKTALSLLQSGNHVLIFPEGTRSPDGNLRPANPGIGLLAAKAHVPVVPCYVSGSYGVLPKGAKFPRLKKIRIFYGRPVIFDDLLALDLDSRELYARIGQRIMASIAALRDKGTLSPSYPLPGG